MSHVAAALVAALLVASPFLARADDDDEVVEEANINMNVPGGSFSFGVNVNGKKRAPTPPSNANVNVKVDASNVNVKVEASAHEEFSSDKPGESYRLTYDSAPSGKTIFKVLAPEHFGVRVTDGGREVLRDSVPAAFDTVAGHYYRIEIFTSEAVVFDRKFEAKAQRVAQLWVNAAAPVAQNVNVNFTVTANQQPAPVVVVAAAAAPSCLGAGELGSIKEEIEGESFSNQKLAVLSSAASGRWFCTSQVIEVLDLYDFSSDKLEALRTMKPRIIDRENHFKIFKAFTFDSDKQQAKAILGK